MQEKSVVNVEVTKEVLASVLHVMDQVTKNEKKHTSRKFVKVDVEHLHNVLAYVETTLSSLNLKNPKIG